MVRAHMKQPSEEKKESPKKKTPPKKKVALTGIWPCKINGCNKQFAREADLKRHQRTTKLHSMPGFACPQCDATFTRTDALRRHQKSRHNGVIIEPAGTERNKDTEDDEAGSSGSKSMSRSSTPSAKNKEPPPTALAQPGTAGPPSGSSSYYRQHTAKSSGVAMDPQYPQAIALPTSATRLHQANWPPPPWGPDAHIPPLGQIPHLAYQMAGPHPIYYQPSPYYRPNPGILPPHTQSPHQGQMDNEVVQTQGMQNGKTSSEPSSAVHSGSSPDSVVVDPRLSQPDSSPVQRTMDVDGTISASHAASSPKELPESFSTAPVIDPSLDAPSAAAVAGNSDGGDPEADSNQSGSEQMTALSLKITQAAVEAVLESVRRENNLVEKANRGSRSLDQRDADDLQKDGFQPNDPVVRHQLEADRENGEADGKIDDERLTTPNEVYHTSLHLSRPEPMEHIITEDGETMLNPAELLTQESLASPPPS